MAKKGFKKRRSGRRLFARTRRSRRSGGGNWKSLLVGAVVYGAARQQISTAIAPFTQRIPLGNIADEVGMIALAFAAKKFVRNPMVNNVANAAITIEAARIGEAVVSGQLGSLGVTDKSAVPGALW